jgi:tight adherence protein C
MLFLLAILFVAAAVFAVTEAATYPSRLKERSVRLATQYGRIRIAQRADETLRFRERVLVPATAKLASIPLKLNPRTNVDAIGARLLAAGLAQRLTPSAFLAIKGGTMVGCGLLGLLLLAAASIVSGMVLLPVLCVIGFVGPDFFLSTRVKRRREAVRGALPDALDLLAVSVEAGLGFDGAVTKLTEHMEGPLVDEFALTLGEIRIGESRHEALKKFTERVPTPEVASFVRSVIQADQLGISLGRILRVQGADSRLRRQAAAEEKAMKAPIKMLFPTVLFIFPAMFLVILGPALLNLMHYFKQ